MPTQIPEDVRQVLQRSTIAEDHLVLPLQLDRKLYVKTDEVMRSIGIVWNKKRKVHVFEKPDAAGKLQEALGSGEFTIEKKEFEVFETPEDSVLELPCGIVKSGDVVRELRARSGRLVTAALMAGAKSVLAVDVRPGAVDRRWNVFLRTRGSSMERRQSPLRVLNVRSGLQILGPRGFAYDG